MVLQEFVHDQRRWDRYFLDVATVVAENSKCLSRKIGAIIVQGRSIIATGYNGPARGVRHCDQRCRKVDEYDPLWDEAAAKKVELKPLNGTCPRRLLGYKSGEGIHLCPAGHAERNAISNAAKLGVKCEGATMYMTCPTPCKDCLGVIIGAGISEIVVLKASAYDELSQYILNGAAIRMRTYSHLEG